MCVAHFSALLNWRLLLSNDLLLKVAHRVAFLVVSLRLLRTAVSSTVLHSVFQTVWSIQLSAIRTAVSSTVLHSVFQTYCLEYYRIQLSAIHAAFLAGRANDVSMEGRRSNFGCTRSCTKSEKNQPKLAARSHKIQPKMQPDEVIPSLCTCYRRK